MSAEIWKPLDIVNVDRRYSISDHGRVKSFVRNDGGVILKPYKMGEYLGVALRHIDGGKQVKQYVHRLVCLTFIPKNRLDCVNHKNGIKHDNNLSNLEWSSYSNNTKHAYSTGLAAVGENCTSSKLTEREVLIISKLMSLNKLKDSEIAISFNVKPSTISNIRHKTRWKHLW